MQPIAREVIQQRIDALKNEELYIHLEMTTGAYSAHFDSSKHPAATFITNAQVKFIHGTISEEAPYRVGLKMDHGWIYSEGLTHYEETDEERLILAGHDSEGKLVVALQLSRQPF
ncbi:YojF family protein [Paenibacillus yanchengensis]|uniref:YojF family protein n=1 Tax=Paenibacillus yanchengensis TaxID=2035833 RepID=A0ABW4YP10_9BACL